MSRLPAVLQKQAFKVIGSPLFIISNPKLDRKSTRLNSSHT